MKNIRCKYKTENGGWKTAKCDCCNQVRYFQSFEKGREWCKSQGFEHYRLQLMERKL